MFKNFKQADLFLQLSSVILTTTGTIVGTITLNNYDSEKFFKKN